MWFEKAATQGFAPAQNDLGLCYVRGEGVEQDYKKAVYWFEKAAEQNNAEALHNLANCYSDGYGVTEDKDKATGLYVRAAKLGNDSAEAILNDMGVAILDVSDDEV